MMILVEQPYVQQETYLGAKLSAYKCNEPGCDHPTRLTRQAMIVHLAVSHGIRPVSKERLDAQQIR